MRSINKRKIVFLNKPICSKEMTIKEKKRGLFRNIEATKKRKGKVARERQPFPLQRFEYDTCEVRAQACGSACGLIIKLLRCRIYLRYSVQLFIINSDIKLRIGFIQK